ncbi:MAG TPA: glycosyltransferase family 4 protein [Ruminococcus flavefaciens]|nr:glycosyltransferase family 4 protein [Ruminococcus flavefaciens]
MRERKERVLMVHNFYQIGGGEHTVFENEKRLVIENGHHLVEYTRDNVELKHSVIKKLMLPFSTVFSVKTYRDVKRIIKKEKIDIVHCHNTFPLISPSVYYAAWKCHVPVVQTIHNFRFMCPNGILFSDGKVCEDCIQKGLGCSIKKGCYRNSKLQTIVVANMLKIHRILGTYKKLRYIFLTEFNRTKFKTLLGSKYAKEFIKPNFEYINDSTDDFERDDSFIFVGRLDGYKGIPFLMNAWKDIQRDLYIFGDGEYKDTVIETQKHNPHIHYMGFRQQSEIFDYLKRAKALIFPSELYEGFPMTLIESFSFGTPVICSDIGNGADIVKKANAGIVFGLGNKNDFQNAVAKIDEAFDNLSRNARKAYKNHFTPEANYKELKRIYEKVISEYE